MRKQEPGNQPKLGLALAGLGNYSKAQLAPALQQTTHCYLAGLISGSPRQDTRMEKRLRYTRQPHL